jgi:hypothetical protein
MESPIQVPSIITHTRDNTQNMTQQMIVYCHLKDAIILNCVISVCTFIYRAKRKITEKKTRNFLAVISVLAIPDTVKNVLFRTY